MSGYHRSSYSGYSSFNSYHTYDAAYSDQSHEETPIPSSSQSSYYSAAECQQHDIAGRYDTPRNRSRDARAFDRDEGRRPARRNDMYRRDQDAYAHHSRYVVSESSSPPREPRAHRAPVEHDRDARSVTPPPPRPPSPTYLALTEGSPSHLSNPAESRKLLILDLNGTLVFRSSHNPRTRAREKMPGEDGHFLPRLRPVHPRPYMPAFRSYVFAPQTRVWLDVMVWSSAQPHSVNDMVEHCFGDQKQHLVAVWARDTLGLSEDHYKRKVQTVKDLAKPWAQLPSLIAHSKPSPASSAASTPRSTRSPSPADQAGAVTSVDSSPQAHSALTTLLLDDSPRKAELQPYNHVCIGEYSAERRAQDLEALTKEKEWETAVAAREAVDAFEESRAGELPVRSSPEAEKGDAAEDDAGVSKKRKRREAKLKKLAARLEAYSGPWPVGMYDETLLAVVGVLDTIRQQSNVAAWIRAGELWGPAGAPHGMGHSVSVPGGAPAPSRDSEETQPTQTLDSKDDDRSLDNAPSSADSTLPVIKKLKRKHLRAATETKVNIADDTAGNDTVTLSDAAPQSSPHDVVSHTIAASVDTETSPSPIMWFEDTSTFAFWARRGREALQELGIPVEHGIER